MKLSLAKARIVRNTCGLLGAALMLCHCGTGATGYVGGASSNAGSAAPLATPSSGAPKPPSVANMTSGFSFDATTATGVRHPASDTAYYTQTAMTLANLVTGASPGALINVGHNQNGTCVLGFPKPSNAPANLSGDMTFSATDEFDALLTALDAQNARVVLEVEPGFAPTGQLASVVMSAYAQHPCVVGFGINLAHNNVAAASVETTFADSDASYVVGRVQSVNASAQLYLRGANTSMLPSTQRTGIVFVDDQSGFASQADQISAMQTWATRFAPAQVAYSIGAAADATWWCSSSNDYAAANLVAGLLGAPPTNLGGIFWSSDSLDEVFPTQMCGAAVGTAVAPTP